MICRNVRRGVPG